MEGKIDGCIGIRTDSKRLYFAVCQEMDALFEGKTDGRVWQLFIEVFLERCDVPQTMNRLLALAEPGEHIAVYGYAIESMDFGTYYNNFGVYEYEFTDVALDDHDETRFWEVLQSWSLIDDAVPDAETRALHEADHRAMKKDKTWYYHRLQKEREQERKIAVETHSSWKSETTNMINQLQDYAETPFGDCHLLHMKISRWFVTDPRNLVPKMRELNMVYECIPFVWNTLDGMPQWIIVSDDLDRRVEEIACDDYHGKNRITENLSRLLKSLSAPRHARVCTYDAAAVAMERLSEADRQKWKEENLKQLESYGPIHDLLKEHLAGKNAVYEKTIDEGYVLMMQTENISMETTECKGSNIGLNTISKYEVYDWLEQIDYLVIGSRIESDNSVLQKVLQKKQNTGKPAIILEDDLLRQYPSLLERSEERKPAFDPALYTFSNRDTVKNRALHSVSEPVQLDREKRGCRFISKQSDSTYFTTLYHCTCPAFQEQPFQACKHMFRLAMYLGYIDPVASK